ncbi:chromosome-associated kinesin KIF4A isoform X1 [Stomoxys calcitrans]|uniref:chromosome-associated kinesin KIF4A isoform X1 n=1 Tax=Stomoxys calcitrans TaxID=35570 RepID=UPI0027E2F854|nr:chromosome-associated kinesin KIF4A isoform X1 [Stomoxys calcitrans]
MGDLESVRVALRVRPLVPSEINRGCQVAVEKVEGQNQVVVNNTDAFSFNFVFDYQDTQEQVYNMSVSDMLDKLFGGFNATILAYGQTGSGKTHTMGTAFNGALDADVGVIPRAMHDIFERIKKLSDSYDFSVKCSFMELYQEQLYDLLSNKSRDESIVDMREDRSGIIMVGLTEQQVLTAQETTDCLVRGSTGRAVASTAMNEASSRSHAIFTVTLQATKKDESRAVTTSKFHLVDLAGSERSKKTGATGDRFKEGVKINQGLLALGNVISALGDGKGAGFVRYRDSKLTRLLQDSLGGNSVTLMIACVSPADYNVAETLSTLRYADRARKIKNKPIVNQDPHAAEINRLKGIIQKLRVELLTKGGTMSSSLTTELEGVTPPVLPLMTSSMPNIVASEEQNRKYKELQDKYRALQQQWQMTLHDVTEHELRAHIAETAQETLKTKTDEMKSYILEISSKCKNNSMDEEKLMETVMCISKMVEGFDEELAKAQTELMDHKNSSSMGDSVSADMDGENEENEGSLASSSEMHALVQERTDAFTNKQMEINDQLRRINRELSLKEQLQQRMAGNFSKFSTLDEDMEEKFKECEQKIQELENEKAELLDKLKHVKENASAKLAEERRKRLQALEQEINDMKRKNLQQAKLLKIREKETQKIKNLSFEIQAMKESKVKLIRAMRAESENFRQFKMMREKELMQLRNKDRKMQNEMARKEALHNKQRNVLKRKCEEAMAINKRLKDALERQKVAQTQRQKLQSAKDANAASMKIDQVIACVEREIEVIISLIDAERTLEQLMDDRGIISSRLGELQKQQPLPEPNSQAALEIAVMQEEIDMRNAQISDLQQKVCANDLDKLIQTLADSVQSIAEARAVFKHLLKSLVELRREQAQATEDLRSQLHAADDRCNEAFKTIKQMKLEHEEVIAEYEEKITVALTPEQEQRLKLQEEQQKKIESLMIELENYKQIRAADMNHTPLPAKKKKSSAKSTAIKEEEADKEEYIEEIEVTSEEEDGSTSSSDPDWEQTPLVRKKRANSMQQRTFRISKSMSQSDISHHMEEDQQQISFESNHSGTLGGTTKATGQGQHKRKSKGCSCRGNCCNKRCGCNSLDQKCSVNCSCTALCKNRIMPIFENDDESSASANVVAANDTDAAGDAANSTHIMKNGKRSSTNANSNDSVTDNENDHDDNNKNKSNTSDDTYVTTKSNLNATTAYLTPKMARLSTFNFDTATAKKKFFND